MRTTETATTVVRRRAVGRRRTALAGALLNTALAVAACAPAPVTPPAGPVPPVVTTFVGVTARSEAPVTTTLLWNISDLNGDTLTCRLDTDGDTLVDRTVDRCDNADSVLVTYTGEGPWNPVLEVDDGNGGVVRATTTVEVMAGPSEPYEITLLLSPTMRPEFRAAFDLAAARWSEVLRAGLPDRTLTLPADFLGWIPAYDGPVDDVLIAARDYEIDGSFGTLGRAGALLTRETGGQAYFGIMEFDTADLDRLAASGRLRSVVLHEMGHVLGIGADLALEGFVEDLLTDPRYNGPAGVTAWRELGGTGKVPLENQGGLGTVVGHWRESVFNNELMTGFSDPDERLSRLTVAALADQGYGVDLAAADLYSLPVAPALRLPAAQAGGTAVGVGDEVGHTDPVATLPPGLLPGT